LNFSYTPIKSGPRSIGLSYVWIAKKKALRGRRYASDCEVKNMMHTWLPSQPKTFFADRIRRLVNSYTICVEKKKGVIMLINDTLHLLQAAEHELINQFTLFLTLPRINV
jgi:hypothetical protein